MPVHAGQVGDVQLVVQRVRLLILQHGATMAEQVEGCLNWGSYSLFASASALSKMAWLPARSTCWVAATSAMRSEEWLASW